jgi:preprotein translocase SecE subunit
LDHSSGSVDEFDAALVRGAEGVPVTPEELPDQPEPVDAQAGTGDALPTVEPPREEIDSTRDPGEVQRRRREPLPSRAVAFLRASWAELQRMQWPDRPQVFQATGVVLGFVVVAGLYLGGADWVAQKIVNLIL